MNRKIRVKPILAQNQASLDSIFTDQVISYSSNYLIAAIMHTSKTIAAFAIVAMTSLIPYNLFMNAHQVCLFFIVVVRMESP